jgi:hypothetical protein
VGGSGSGRPQVKDEIERKLALDVKDLKKYFKFVGIPSTHTWTEGFFKASICLVRHDDNIELRYVFNEVKVIEKIPLIYFPCFKATRTWFLCPGCLQKKRIIYSPGRNSGGFRCKVCQNLSYESQRQTGVMRMIVKWRKQIDNFERKYGILIEAGLKPKGMHMKTYKKKLSELLELKDLMSVCIQDEIDKKRNKYNEKKLNVKKECGQ